MKSSSSVEAITLPFQDVHPNGWTVRKPRGTSIRELRADVVALAAEVRDLRRRLGRNSGNSSMAPSADDLPGRTLPPAKPKRGGGGRRPGKQPGAPGSHLAWSESPDDTVPHFPRGACGCGADLAAAADLGVAASHQVVDVPLETAKVTQHDLHEVACSCGRVHRAAAPAGAAAAGTVTYGLALQAWCVYLIAAHAIPVHRCAELIEALTGAEPSPGFVHSMIARAAAAVAQANRAIRCLIILAHVISADETPIRVGPGPKTRKRYLLVACTSLLTYYFLGDRSMKTFTAFVLPDMDRAVVVHDRYQNYDAIPGLIHQLCCQHLLRDLAAAAQEYPRRALAGPGHPGAAGPDPRREHRPRPGPARHPGRHRRAADPRVQARGPGRPVPGPPRARPQAGARPRPAGMPARPAG